MGCSPRSFLATGSRCVISSSTGSCRVVRSCRVDVNARGGGPVHTSGERKGRQDGDIDVTNGSSCYAEREVREGGAR